MTRCNLLSYLHIWGYWYFSRPCVCPSFSPCWIYYVLPHAFLVGLIFSHVYKPAYRFLYATNIFCLEIIFFRIIMNQFSMMVYWAEYLIWYLIFCICSFCPSRWMLIRSFFVPQFLVGVGIFSWIISVGCFLPLPFPGNLWSAFSYYALVCIF